MSWPWLLRSRQIAPRTGRVDVVNVGVFAHGDGLRCAADDLAVLEDLAAPRDLRNADLVAEGDVLEQLDVPLSLALQSAVFAGASRVDEGGHVIGGMKNDASGHD